MQFNELPNYRNCLLISRNIKKLILTFFQSKTHLCNQQRVPCQVKAQVLTEIWVFLINLVWMYLDAWKWYYVELYNIDISYYLL